MSLVYISRFLRDTEEWTGSEEGNAIAQDSNRLSAKTLLAEEVMAHSKKKSSTYIFMVVVTGAKY
jgi:hypothetical protein